MNPSDYPAVSVAAIEQLTARRQALVEQIGKAVIGQQEIIDNTLLTLFAGGHALITGVPGLAKTLLIRSHQCFTKFSLTGSDQHAELPACLR